RILVSPGPLYPATLSILPKQSRPTSPSLTNPPLRSPSGKSPGRLPAHSHHHHPSIVPHRSSQDSSISFSESTFNMLPNNHCPFSQQQDEQYFQPLPTIRPQHTHLAVLLTALPVAPDPAPVLPPVEL